MLSIHACVENEVQRHSYLVSRVCEINISDFTDLVLIELFLGKLLSGKKLTRTLLNKHRETSQLWYISPIGSFLPTINEWAGFDLNDMAQVILDQWKVWRVTIITVSYMMARCFKAMVSPVQSLVLPSLFIFLRKYLILLYNTKCGFIAQSKKNKKISEIHHLPIPFRVYFFGL